MTNAQQQQWEYRVVHININNDTPPQPPSPQSASQKLGGSLSPEFIAKEFPKVYSRRLKSRRRSQSIRLSSCSTSSIS